MFQVKSLFSFKWKGTSYFLQVQFLLHCMSFFSLSLGNGPPKLLLVSFDGFRWNYLNRTSTPNFHKVIGNGVYAKHGIKNVFVTQTFPNHFTLVTGLYVESHGIVSNYMFDPVLKASFSIRNISQVIESEWFDTGAEPIWVTNELHDSNRKSGILYWPGNSASIKHTLPTKYSFYNSQLPYKTRIDIVLSWFKDKFPVNLGHLYFEEPDHTGHAAGPESDNVTQLIGRLDNTVGYLLKRMRDLDLVNEMNVIITSDHGMVSTPKEKIINLNEFIDPHSYEAYSETPVLLILPHDKGKAEEIYKNLSSVPNLTVYKKQDIPEEYHYKNNRRILPILVVANEHYSFIYKNTTDHGRGNHGYNNSLPSMHPFFMAMGPAFKKNKSIDTFNSVDIYPMMCHILGLKPAPNNGSLHNVMSLLKDDIVESSIYTFSTYIAILVFGGLIGGIYTIAACRQYRYSKRRHQRFSLQGLSLSLKYVSPPNNNATARLLSDSEDEEAYT